MLNSTDEKLNEVVEETKGSLRCHQNCGGPAGNEGRLPLSSNASDLQVQ